MSLSSSLRPLIACLLALVIAGCDRQSVPAAQDDGATAGEVAAGTQQAVAPTQGGGIDRSHRGEPMPRAGFVAPDGHRVTLLDFRGKPVLVNLWATWCAPCVAEMPTLDRMAEASRDRVTVLAISQDLDGKAKVAPFFAAHRFAVLKPYLDPEIGLSQTYAANLPLTVMYDADGREVWRMTGGNDWGTPAARALVAEAG